MKTIRCIDVQHAGTLAMLIKGDGVEVSLDGRDVTHGDVTERDEQRYCERGMGFYLTGERQCQHTQ